MCSQRIAAANLRPSLRRALGWCGGTVESLLCCRSLAAIRDRGGFELDIPLEFLDERSLADRHGFADVLIGPVLAGDVDGNHVLAGREGPVMVVEAVPDHVILAGRA